VGGDERAVGGEDAQPVAVPIARERDVERLGGESGHGGAEVLGNRFRVDAAERGVDLGPDRRDPRRVPVAEDRRQEVPGAAVHRVPEDVEARPADRVQVDAGGDRRGVGREEVDLLHGAAGPVR
jgi:hypothetical protein